MQVNGISWSNRKWLSKLKSNVVCICVYKFYNMYISIHTRTHFQLGKSFKKLKDMEGHYLRNLVKACESTTRSSWMYLMSSLFLASQLSQCLAMQLPVEWGQRVRVGYSTSQGRTCWGNNHQQWPKFLRLRRKRSSCQLPGGSEFPESSGDSRNIQKSTTGGFKLPENI